MLYSFRRCPYAIRARMALSYANIDYELHEVFLKDKPLDFIKASPKGTVPVLILENGTVLDESLDIIKWALKQSDPEGWLTSELEPKGDELIHFNDTQFKPILDNYKYPPNSDKKVSDYYRKKAIPYLRQLNLILAKQKFLLADHISFADIAIFPFLRQFYMVDKGWFIENDFEFLRAWLDYFLSSEFFLVVMKKSS
ncbi:MAG: glutathione S-transferase N-terminal domain-containing protein [Tatlockia sp.]|nr:glutathione S-transferase N-terminal domain-containing protein [Tatlockia sp.]